MQNQTPSSKKAVLQLCSELFVLQHHPSFQGTKKTVTVERRERMAVSLTPHQCTVICIQGKILSKSLHFELLSYITDYIFPCVFTGCLSTHLLDILVHIYWVPQYTFTGCLSTHLLGVFVHIYWISQYTFTGYLSTHLLGVLVHIWSICTGRTI